MHLNNEENDMQPSYQVTVIHNPMVDGVDVLQDIRTTIARIDNPKWNAKLDGLHIIDDKAKIAQAAEDLAFHIIPGCCYCGASLAKSEKSGKWYIKITEA